MKKLFTAIQKNDLDTVKELLDKTPSLIFSTFKGSPKKFDGQSPLQVALKVASNEMICLLLGYSPDVNFIEGEDCLNSWRAPVIHDAINRAIMESRWNVNRPDGIEVYNSESESNDAFAILERIVEMGADVNAKDSYGNACLNRACLQARQILPANGSNDRILTKELRSDISRIFDLLISHGADTGYISPNASGRTIKEQYGNEILGEFI